MTSRLVNVRLDADRLRKAQTLRARGMALSDVVREAIDERFAALRRRESRLDVRAIIRRIFEQYPRFGTEFRNRHLRCFLQVTIAQCSWI